MRAFGAGEDVLDSATTYLRIRALGVAALLVILVGHGAFRGYQDTRTPLAVTLGLNAVNLILDPILIFGLDCGVAGAASATVNAQWFGVAWFAVLFFWTRRAELAIGFERSQRSAVGSLAGAGMALILRNASLLAALTAATVVAARIGTAEVAARQIAMQLWIFLALIVDAFAIAGQAIVGKELGAEKPAVARSGSNRLPAMGFSFGVAPALGLTAVAPWLGSWLTSDEAVLLAVASILPILIMMQPINGIVFVWDGVAIGAAAFLVLAWSALSAAIATIGFLLVVIPLG